MQIGTEGTAAVGPADELPVDPPADDSAAAAAEPDEGEGAGRAAEQRSPIVRVRHADVAELQLTAAKVPARDEVGQGGAAHGRGHAPSSTVEDVVARAQRLREWAAEESGYVSTHSAAFFSPVDVSGRDSFADEGLYDLLPRLRRDAGRLRSAIGPGPMATTMAEVVAGAGVAVQAYVVLWRRLRDEARDGPGLRR